MEKQTKRLTAFNEGEMKAILSYEIKKIRILTDEYIVNEDFTQEDLIEMLNNYPFKLIFEIDNTNLNQENGSADFDVSLTWAFESGNDALDTTWGEKAYEYNKQNPGMSSIYVEVDVKAVQSEA